MSGGIKERTVYMLCRIGKVEDDGTDVYIGSTSKPLCQRFSEHKQNAGNPSRLKYHGNSKLYRRIREVGVQRWKIVPLLSFACTRKTTCEFEKCWVKATGANLNTNSPITDRKEYDVAYREANSEKIKENYKKNIMEKRYYCNICDIACGSNHDLKKHYNTLSHSYAWLNAVD